MNRSAASEQLTELQKAARQRSEVSWCLLFGVMPYVLALSFGPAVAVVAIVCGAAVAVFVARFSMLRSCGLAWIGAKVLALALLWAGVFIVVALLRHDDAVNRAVSGAVLVSIAAWGLMFYAVERPIRERVL